MRTPSEATPNHRRHSDSRLGHWLRILERALPLVVVLVVAAGWYVTVQYQRALEQAVIAAYQETQLEIVRAVARNTEFFVEAELRVGRDIANIEQEIFKRFVDPVRLLKNGDAWIYAPTHVVFDPSSDFPEEYRGKSMAEIFALQVQKGANHYEAMTADVMNAREGVGWYVWLPDKGKEIAAWTPVRFRQHVWTIGMSTPLPEIIEASGAERQTRFLFTVMGGVTLLGLGLSLLSTWSMVRHRQLDAQLRASHGELQALVSDLKREIERRQSAEVEREQLGEQLLQAKKMEAVGLLAGGVAHDLNNILTGLVSYPELLLMQLPATSPLHEGLLTIQRSGERAAEVVQDLLTLSRRGVAVAEPVDLNQILSDYLQSAAHQRLGQEHGKIVEEICLDANLLSTYGSRLHLSKMITNLVFNAFEAMPEGGSIVIRTENCCLESGSGSAAGLARGEYVRLSISDGGRALSAEDRHRIFEPFYTKKVLGRSGSGLSLAVVWGVVQDHKGAIKVKPGPEGGTTFEILLPATRERVAETAAPLPREQYLGHGESVLVVDDLELQRQTASAMLQGLGYRVAAVPSGADAVAHLKERRVDLVVLDMILGSGMDGLDTYREILKISPGQRAIIASGFSETERVREAQRLGAGAYIRKPYLIQDLGLAVRAELNRR